MSVNTTEPATASVELPGLRQVPVHRRLMFRVPAIVASSGLIILALVFLLLEIAVKPSLRELADKSVARSSALIGQELRKRITIAGMLCQELARTGELLPQDAQEHMRVLPHLIDGVGDDWFIAGGGVWPEPGLFTPGVERRSFFFGRLPDGCLKYYDEYNDPAGPGYHHEEWYVPVQFVDRGTVYWSRSYVDPYSHEPMVTCSAPMRRDGRYYGVATIDVKLSGLRELFEAATSEIAGYAFAVDREGTFLSFPDDALIRTVRLDSKGTKTDSFLSAQELAATHPLFTPIAALLEGMDVGAIGRAKANGRFSADVARRIHEGSYQIDARQAELIAGLLSGSREPPEERCVDVGDEIRLREGCIVTVLRMPDTGWKIVTVMPQSRALAASRRLYLLLMLSLGGVMIVGLGGTLLVLYRDIVQPITRMTRSLGQAADGQPRSLEVPGASDSEFGLLACTINAYSRQFADAMKALATYRDELEARVADRTQELRESNAALELARRDADLASTAKSEFLANMSHEIRTPLTAILGFTDLLGEGGHLGVGAGQQLQAIDTIRNAGAHLLTVINDILDLSKIEAGRMTVERVDTPLVGVLREVESLMRPRAVGKGVALNTVLATPVPQRVMSDPTRLRQILINLAGNAVKFTEVGSITVVVRVQDASGQSRLWIDVEDTGPGMTTEQSERLFAAFGQADSTLTRRYGGTGLGLTISRRLASLMGGTVALIRTEPGRGSCFRVDLPLEPVPGTSMATRLEAPAEVRAAGSGVTATLDGRILLAEDGVDNQRLIAFQLRKAGATVEIAANGRAALAMLDQAAAAGTPFDLLLTDMQMPEMDGYALARTLRSRGSTIAIVAITAHAMADDRVRCAQAGCDDYTTKPIDKAQLLARCAAWMGRTGGAAAMAIAASESLPQR